MSESPEKGGVLREQGTGGKRAVVALGFSAAILGTPLLVLSSPASHAVADPAPAGNPARASNGPGSLAGTTLARFQSGVGEAAIHSGTPTTIAVAVTARTTPDPQVETSTTIAPTTTTVLPKPTTTVPQRTTTTTTTTTVPPTTTTTRPPDTQSGIATWYAESPPGGCASPTLPRGTVLTVTDDATGARITCQVDDVEGDNPGRVVDLAPGEFSQLADLSQGVIEVTLSW